MNPELWLVVLPALGWLLFALGGTEISEKVKGQKWIRRFVYPLVLGGSVGVAVGAWQGVVTGVIACVAFHQGYGERAGWVKRALIFTGYGLISIAVGVSVWNIATAVGALAMFWLSNQKWSAKMWTWKICEGAMGGLIGIQVGYLLAGSGMLWGF